jgi:uncharacterized protein YgiM (DUF1202 family)
LTNIYSREEKENEIMTEETKSSNTNTILMVILIIVAAFVVVLLAALVGMAIADDDTSDGDTGTGAQPTPTIEYITVPPAQEGGPSGTATADLNVRSGPSTDLTSYGIIQKDTTFQITGQTEDGSWWQINYPPGDNGVGWCSADYVKAENVDDVPVVTP